MNNEPNGFVKLNRSLLNWEWHDVPAMMTVFIHCLLLANWKDGRYHGIEVPRGSFLTSYEKISDATGVPRSTVRRCIEKLCASGEIDAKVERHGMHVFVRNYAGFQGVDDTMLERKWNESGTKVERKRNGNGTEVEREWNGSGTRVDPIEEYKEYKEEKEKKEKKEKKEYIAADAENVFFQSFPKTSYQDKARNTFRELLGNGYEPETILGGLKPWLKYWSDFNEEQKHFIPNPNLFLQRKQFLKQPPVQYANRKRDALPDYYDPDPDRETSGERMTEEEQSELRALLDSTRKAAR